MAGRVVVMNHGKIEQTGTPDRVYDHPASPFVFELLGHVKAPRFALEPDRQIINVELLRTTSRALQLGPGARAYLQPMRLRQFDKASTAG